MIRKLFCALLAGSWCFVWSACSPSHSAVPTVVRQADAPQENACQWEKAPVYPWYKGRLEQAERLCEAIPTPKGYTRQPKAAGSWAAWLRHLPLLPKGSPVMLHNGQAKSYQAGAYRVLDIDIGAQNLQQCADAIMRLRAEYLYSQRQYGQIHFNYTSGHKVAFADWAKGRKPKVAGNSVSFSAPPPNASANYSYDNFRQYLVQVFNYAGTASLEKELKPVPVEDIQAGDVFIQGGFPGHAVLVLDVATNAQGKKIFLLAQSYMPAQSIHVLHNLDHASLSIPSPWYSLDFGSTLHTPEWDFKRASLRRFAE